MGDDIPCLEIPGIGCYLEHQVLRKGIPVVAEMQPRKMYIPVSVIRFVVVNIAVIAPVFSIQPPYAALHQVLFCWRVTHAGITFHGVNGGNIPGIFQEGNTLIFGFPLPGEQVAIECPKVLLNKQWDILIAVDVHIPVVAAFNSAFAGEGIYDQVLVTIGIGHTKPYGQHELGRMETDLDRAEKIIIQFLFFFFVHFHHKEFEITFYVRVQHLLLM